MSDIERLQKHVEAERQARDYEQNVGCGQQATGLTGDRPTVEALGNILGRDTCEAQAPKPLKVALSGNAAEVLRCLFFHGPTWDGNVPSKSGRDELVSMGLAARGKGWQWLTRAGIDACFANGIHDEKDRHESQQRQRRANLRDVARAILNFTPMVLVALMASFLAAPVEAQTSARTAMITFTRPTQYTDGTAIAEGTEVTYHVYQGARGTDKPRVATITATATTINTGLQPGETCWQVTAIANGVESAMSNEACKTFEWPATEAVIITVT